MDNLPNPVYDTVTQGQVNRYVNSRFSISAVTLLYIISGLVAQLPKNWRMGITIDMSMSIYAGGGMV